ncbi:nitrate- and nitrite sensing domain-containing protein [Planomonospora alba]|uniref:histidine kinase n=1 Tax=Planomonospora alba TaxID=161354 RepID=A0ABP6NBF9_9ACTN
MASSRSIRFKVSALLAAPVASLVVLWGAGAFFTVSDALDIVNVDRLSAVVSKPVDDLVIALQREHLLSAEYLVTRSSADRGGLATQRVIADQARDRLRGEEVADATESLMSDRARGHFAELMTRVEKLDELRGEVDRGRIGLVALSAEFGRVADVAHRLDNSMGSDVPPELYERARALFQVNYAKEFFNRQRALGTAVLMQDRPMTGAELVLFGQLSAKRGFLMEHGLAELEKELRAPVDQVTASRLHERFTDMEERLLSGGTVSAVDWRSVTEQLDAAFQVALNKSSAALGDRSIPMATGIFARAGGAGVLGLAAVVVSVLVSYRVGRGLTRELAGLRRAATELAEVRLPRVMEKLRRGERVDTEEAAPPLELGGSTTEVRAVAAAFDSVQHRALDAAVEQARLREGVAHAFRNLARRKQGLLQRQLKLLDGMQKEAEDPQTLEKLFTLDHLTTRMRRHAEGLVILSGGAAGRKWRSAIPMEDVLRGAAAQVEDYARVRIYPMPPATLSGSAVADMMHLFAELIENATAFSPPGGEVSVRGAKAARGFAVEVEDRGLGLTKEKRDEINVRLASPPEFDPAETDRLGFSVVGLLAARYGVAVTLRPSPYGGTTVVVLVPESLLGEPGPQAAGPAAAAGTAVPAQSAGTGEPAVLTGPAGLTEHAGALGEGGAGEEAAAVPARAHSALDGRRAPQRRGLPRRVRQANLTPQLRQGEPEAATPDETSVSRMEERSPEEARALLSSLQSGWRRGRSESEDNGGEGA